MKRFNKRDVKRIYDLLQHDAEHGLTQLNALDGEDLIGAGLFDNEDDFVSECERYNTLGALWVGINPRSKQLLDEYSGLHNRMRTLITDVVSLKDIACVTGFVASEPLQLTEAALAYQKDVSVLSDGAFFFPMDKPVLIEDRRPGRLAKQVAQWFLGEATLTKVDLLQMVPVPGTEDPEGTWLRPRIKFRKFRPYILEGISTAVRGDEDES